MNEELSLDEIGHWTEIKLEIIKKYAKAYSKILSSKSPIKKYVYIDAFAGAGVHKLKVTGKLVPGSPQIALNIEPPFNEYYFIDLDGQKIQNLKKISEDRNNVFVYEGDCNEILLDKVFPRVRYEDYHRGLCLLDPYGLHLDWNVIKKAGEMRSIEIFLNFPAHDINRNVLWTNLKNLKPTQIRRMNLFWGDDSWIKIIYREEENLFKETEQKKIAKLKSLLPEYKSRLVNIAGFKFVPEPIPMLNTKGGLLYYLYFASPNQTGARITNDIFNKYKNTNIEQWLEPK